MDVETKCYKEAITTLKKCSTKHGLFASGPPHGYDSVFARDAMISFLGAYLLKDLKKQFELTLENLSKHQSKLGQIPNCVDLFSNRKKQVTFATIDSSLWYIIGHFIYKNKYNSNLFNKYKSNIRKALLWVKYQDAGEDSLPEQQPTSDWQDIFPHKYGHVLNTQALYYKVLNLLDEKKLAKEVKQVVNEHEDKKLYDRERRYYLPWKWKSHGKYKEQGKWFDSLANILSILFDLADEKRSLNILAFIEENKIAHPYPMMSIYPPIKPNSKFWYDYFKSCSLKPYSYANAGIWPYIGSLYILALIKYKKFKEAKLQLNRLARGNLKGNFPEWTHPITKRDYGKLQAWDAGTYILAYRSLREKKVLLNV